MTDFVGTSGADSLVGTAGDDRFVGGGGNDTIQGNDGNDVIVLDTAITGGTFNGGNGYDTLELHSQAGAPNGLFGPATTWAGFGVNGIERIDFQSAAGTAVIAGVTSHFVNGATTLNFAVPTDLIGGAGVDNLLLIAVNGMGSDGNLVIPTVTVSNWTTATRGYLAGDVVSLIGVSNATGGGAFNYVLTASETNAANGLRQALYAGTGNDTLNGSSGADILGGGAGTDVLHGNGGNDVLSISNTTVNGVTSTNSGAGSLFDGGNGTDFLSVGGSVNFQGTVQSIEGIYLQPGFTNNAPGTITQSAAQLSIGSATIGAMGPGLELDGTGGIIVTLQPGDSFDGAHYIFDAGSDVRFTINGSTGGDSISATIADDLISGGDGNDYINGDDGNDTLSGGNGDDALTGEDGDDVLTGGGGNDVFATDGDGAKIITDFTVGEDKIDLSDSIIDSFATLQPYLSSSGGNAVIAGGDTSFTLQGVSLASLDANSFIFATPKNLTGTEGNDTIEGSGLNDSLSGLGGNDNLYGEEGNDTLNGGNGDDFIGAGEGDDLVDGGNGNDQILYGDVESGVSVDLRITGQQNTGGGGLDTITNVEGIGGSDYADTLTGTAGNNTLNGADGDDVLYGKGGTDALIGGAGNDIIVLDIQQTNGFYDGGTGYDTLELHNIAGATAGGNGIIGSAYNTPPLLNIEAIDFQSAAGTGISMALTYHFVNAGTGVTNAVPGALHGGSGIDSLVLVATGGMGTDTNLVLPTFSFSNWTTASKPYVPTASDVVLLNAQGNFNYTLTASEANAASGVIQVLSGNIGNDTLNGSSGIDRLNGGTGTNVLHGNGGNDVLQIGNTITNGVETTFTGTGSLFDGGNGTDFLSIGGTVNFQGTLQSVEGIYLQPAVPLAAGANPVTTAYQGPASITISSATVSALPANLELDGTGTITVNLTNASGDSFNGANYIFDAGSDVRFVINGSTGADSISATISNDLISGGDGNDYINGDDGNDTLSGGNGNDTVAGEDGDDVLTGGAGNDIFVADGDGAKAITDFTVGQDRIDLSDSTIDSLATLQPYMSESGGNTIIAGGDTSFTLQGVSLANLDANSFIFATPKNLTGTEGNDTIEGSGLNDSLSGLGGNDNIFGEEGNDTINGGNGDDFIGAGIGNDLIDGGAGNDQVGYLDVDDMGVSVDLRITTQQNTGGGGLDTITNVEGVGGSDNADTLTGTAGNNTLIGNGGDDVLYGKGGTDALIGGAGNDIIVLDTPIAGGTFDGGNGTDMIEAHSISGAGSNLFGPTTSYGGFGLNSIEKVDFQSDAGTAVSVIATQHFVSGPNTLNFAVPTILDGGAGYDTFLTVAVNGMGSDTSIVMPVYTVSNWTNPTRAYLPGDRVGLVGAGNFNYVLNASATNATNGLSQWLIGSGGNDTLNGSSGMDLLSTGGGTDELHGNGGNDALLLTNTIVNGVEATLTGAGTLFDGGNGTDFLAIGGSVNFQGTVQSIEGIYLQPAYTNNAAGAVSQPATQLTIGSATIGAMGPNLELDGTGTIIVNLANASGDNFNGSGYVFDPGSNVQFAINGTAGGDTVSGTSSNDTISGGNGNDLIFGGDGNDVLTGGAGNDVFVVDGDGAKVITDFTVGQDKIDLSNTNVDSFATLQAYLSSSGGNTIIAGGDTSFTLQGVSLASLDANSFIFPTPVNLTGTGGNDLLNGGTLNDSLSGLGGNDTLNGDEGNDTLDGGAGTDVLHGGDDDDILIVANTPSGNEVFDGGVGTDTLLIEASAGTHGNGPAGSTDTVALFGTTLSSIEQVQFDSDPGSRLIALALSAQVGAGISSTATLQGGAGNDSLLLLAVAPGTYTLSPFVRDASWNSSNDVFNPGDTVGLIVGAAGNYTLNAATGHAGVEVLLGGVGNDTLNGTSGSEILNGGGGANTVHGGGGNDLIVISNVTPFGGATTSFTFADNLLDGGNGVDYLSVGGNVSFGGQLQSIEGIDLQAAYTATGAGQASQTDADLDIGSATINALGPNLMIRGIGEISVNVAQGDSFNGSGYVFAAGADVGFEIEGANSNDVLTGTSSYDEISGGAGNDTLTGGAGADTLDGGTGTDRLVGGAGNDSYYVSTANDVIVEAAGQGTDTVYATSSYTLATNVEDLVLLGTADTDATGNSSANVLTGNDGDNVLSGGTGDDTLIGGAGKDTLDGGSGADQMAGGAGSDTYIVGNPGDVVVEDAGGGRDTVQASIGYTLGDNVENLTLTGTSNLGVGNTLDNVITGNSGAETLFGREGNDTLDGGNGPDTMFGDVGDDSYVVDNIGDNANEYEDQGLDTVNASISYDMAENIENLVLTGTSAINGTGNALDNAITGNSAANILAGDDGADSLSGGSGNDTLVGGNGSDRLDGGSGSDLMIGGEGGDTYIVTSAGDVVQEDGECGCIDEVDSSISYTLGANVEDLVLTGTANLNGTGNELDNYLIGNSGTNILSGQDGSDYLYGDAGNDTLNGGEGDDALEGGSGSDRLVGGNGNDIYLGIGSGDVVVEDADGGHDAVYSTVSQTLAANVEDLLLVGTGAVNGTGNALDNVLVGGSGANSLSGLGGNDVLFGDSGNDTLSGGDGDDVLDGGDGSDRMSGGNGNDSYHVSSSGDAVIESASQGTDSVVSSISYTLGSNVENLELTGSENLSGTGNTLANIILGNDGDNSLSGDSGDDRIEGGDGNDMIDGGTGADLMIGGQGDDVFVVGNPADTVIEQSGGGNDGVTSSISYTLTANVENLTLAGTSAINGTGNAEANQITGNDGANILTGLDGDDSLSGGSGNDTLDGGNGNDVLAGGTGSDRMVGGQGDDSYTVSSTGDTVVEAVDGGTDTVNSTITYTLGNNVENLTLTGTGATSGTGNTLDNHLIGNEGDNLLSGSSGNDMLDGGNGNDTLDGGSGTDQMTGGQGDDSYVVGSSTDTVIEQAGQGTDSVTSTVTHTLSDNVENLTLAGTSAINGTGNGDANVITGNDGANVLTGLDGDDNLSGGSGNDTLMGGNGSDSLAGGAGSDRMEGGAGDDVYSVTSSGDVVVEAADEGTDTVRSSVSYTLGANVENLTLTGTTAIDGTGNSAANVLTGNDGANLLDGGSGNDTLSGGAGNDTLDGGAGADAMAGGTGNDSYVVTNSADAVSEQAGEGTDSVSASVSYTLTDNVENLTLTGTNAINGTGNGDANVVTGNGAANVLTGAGGADTLSGGAGNDTIDGGAGSDVLTGGSNRDTFVFSTALGSDNVDSISDFNSASDSFRLYQSIFNGLALGTLAAGQFAVGTDAATSDHRIIYDAGTGSLYFDADGNGGGAASQFATLTNLASISASNFVVV